MESIVLEMPPLLSSYAWWLCLAQYTPQSELPVVLQTVSTLQSHHLIHTVLHQANEHLWKQWLHTFTATLLPVIPA
ncbi:hypothetical protein M432DRAFT_395637 [Thermoascus aurantiacus ATCC 26904]